MNVELSGVSRLMTYIRKGEPYPYNLDRPSPPTEHSAPASIDVKAQEARATSPVDTSSVILNNVEITEQPSMGQDPEIHPYCFAGTQ